MRGEDRNFWLANTVFSYILAMHTKTWLIWVIIVVKTKWKQSTMWSGFIVIVLRVSKTALIAIISYLKVLQYHTKQYWIYDQVVDEWDVLFVFPEHPNLILCTIFASCNCKYSFYVLVWKFKHTMCTTTNIGNSRLSVIASRAIPYYINHA